MRTMTYALAVGVCAFFSACGEAGPDATGDGGAMLGNPNAPLGPLGAGVATLAGTGESGHVDGPRAAARFNNPVNVVVGPEGNVYVADYDNGMVRVVTPTGTVSTLVRQPNFARPFGMAVAPDGTLYVETDSNDLGVRGRTTGTLWRVDGEGTATMLSRDLGRPRGIAALPDGRLVLVDNEHHDVRLFNPTNMMITTLAGSRGMSGFADGAGAAARFNRPYDVVLMGDRLIVTDAGNHRLRAITLDGMVTTFAGTGMPGTVNGTRMAARFNEPQALAVDRRGNLYVAEVDGYVVRRIAPDGNVTTVAGTGAAGFLDGTPTRAQFYGLEGIDASPDGMFLYVADGNRGSNAPSHRVRRLSL